MKKPLIFSKEEMISVKNIARDICCSRQHVYNLIDQGRLKPAFRFGRSKGLFIPRSVLEEFKQNCRVDPGA
ncbi:helix-turn-helix domain-containing protein [Geobacter anodireducens]|uniref:Helix-turn-helix domain-containing protein n=1 Tax=Geobacter anodireducens TaxID=1340425 RepID=A0ABR9NSL0_9BACT|nr:helix-turn-helix domain-containing protein [Geobacter anodireducens]MBE2887236.1 helix-turn-helix domain-containing protein [Geobacter anodireducens]